MRTENEIIREIEEIKRNQKKICLFGAGKLGQGWCYKFVQYLGMKVDCYCDNNPELWGKEIKDDIICISPEELSKVENCVCIIAIGIRFLSSVENQVRSLGIDMITYDELYSLTKVKDYFYSTPFMYAEKEYKSRLQKYNDCKEINIINNEKNKEIAIYTCVAGKYDNVVEPEYISEECDYYLISDVKPEKLNVYKWIDIKSIVPEWVEDNVRRNRYCKINAHSIFPNYKYSIYIDGNISIKGNILHCIKKIGNSGVAAYLHPNHQCIFGEGIRCVIAELDDENIIRTQMDGYKKEGMPENYGQFECGVLVRENRKVQRLMEMWWKEVFTKSYRDQLSFMYCVWKCGMSCNDIGILGVDWRKSKEFHIEKYHKHYRRI